MLQRAEVAECSGSALLQRDCVKHGVLELDLLILFTLLCLLDGVEAYQLLDES
jgi:hypothetical protein